ncbi:MAG: tetratricopeptide repeat protein [Sedimentisphaerales bacterium]|nr:tetratricopeptide repeat protein [Sedimentisphaerales bacterium]
MTPRMTVLTVAVLLAGLWAPAAFAKSAAELLREGLYAEEVEGNLDAAIGIYQQVILDSSAPRNLVAQALYRQGSCYLKKSNEPKARAAFEKLVTEYSDQTELVEKAGPMLEELSSADPATLMPPETLAYAEIGSPGRQVETILNMLKGTPLENPLNALTMTRDPGQTGGRNGQARAGGGNNPVDIIGKILNPAMMAELKKIRSLGVGVTDVSKETPAATIVLFPGRSDAVRGLLQMGLSMLGQTGAPVEGMTTVKFGDGGGAAFDDTVFIVTTPSAKATEQLEWAIRQYKGAARQPTLASANASFAGISKQARQQNALTVWVNVAEVHRRLLKTMPPDQIPPQLKMANELVNFNNVTDLIATLSLRETGVALEANVNLRDGSQSTAYNLIRTPNLNRALLKAVPAEAVALVSLALGDAGTAQAQAARDKIISATGQDLAAQIFGNIEQISLFALPGKGAAPAEWSGIPPALQSIGLAVTSREPQKTQQLLLTLLAMANLVSADTQPQLPASGQYEIILANNMRLLGYTDEASKTMVLSLGAPVIGQSVTAMRQNSSVLDGGKMKDAITTMSPKTSKLVLVSVPGVLALAAQNVHLPSEEAAKQTQQSIEELIKATENTTIRLLTSEEANSFGVRLSISDLPRMSQIVGAVTQITQMISAMKQKETAQVRQAQPALSVPQAGKPLTMKGDEQEWAAVPAQRIEHVAYNASASPEDFSASFKTLWDSQGLYLLVDVVDDKPVNDSVEFWLDDSVEVFIDADNSKSDVYTQNDYQYHFDWEGSRFTAASSQGESRHNKMEGVTHSASPTDKGYRFEIKLPWSTLGVTPRPGTRIGLDVHVNDDDDGGDRDTKLMWHTENDIAWQQPSALGTIELAGLVAWWKLDETSGDKAADSSGNGHAANVQGNARWQPAGGKVGGAIALDGDGDCLEVVDESAFDFTSGVTVAAWIKPTVWSKPWQAIVTKGEGAWRIQRNNEATTLEFACTGLEVPGGNEYGSLFGTRAVTGGEWHHVAGAYDGRKMYLYVDGTLDASQEAKGAIGTDDEPVLIGENAAMRDRFFYGLIDDVRVYNFGLTEAQVRQLYEPK